MESIYKKNLLSREQARRLSRQKSQLLYFELKLLSTLANGFVRISNLYPLLLSLDTCLLLNSKLQRLVLLNKQYQKLSERISQINCISELSDFNDRLEEKLRISRSDRNELLTIMSHILSLIESSLLQDILNQAKRRLDKIILKINDQGWIDDANRLDFENYLQIIFWDSFEKTLREVPKGLANNARPIFNQLHQRRDAELRQYFGGQYKNKIQIVERILFLHEWQIHLQKKQQLLISDANNISIVTILKMKHLLCNEKSACYQSFYKQKHEVMIIAYLLQNIFTINKSPIQKQLMYQQQQLAAEILAIEGKLVDYSRVKSFIAGSLRLFTESYHYKFSKAYVYSAEEITRSRAFTNIPVLNAKLSNDELNFLCAVLSVLLISMDLYSSKWLGLSYSQINALTSYLLSDLDAIAMQTKKLKLTERNTINHFIPVLQWSLGLGIQLCIYSLLLGITLPTMGYFSMSYIFATSCRSMLGKVMDRTVKSDQSTESTSYSLMKGLLQNAGYFGGNFLWQKSFSHLHRFFLPPNDRALLSNLELCAQHKRTCKDAALKRLGLDLNATPAEIKTRWHQLVKLHHPDKRGDSEQYMYVTKATQSLRHLNAF